MSSKTKIWDSFVENGEVSSAYGYRWRSAFGVDQLDVVLKKLTADSSSRHGVIMMWKPDEDLLKVQKNVPCPVMFTLNIIGGKLSTHLMIRSNDMILGNPTDIAGYALLTHILAQKLDVDVGTLTVSISNAHIYENHYEIAEELISRLSKTKRVDFYLPLDSYDRAVNLKDSLVDEIKAGFKNYLPGPSVGPIKIAL